MLRLARRQPGPPGEPRGRGAGAEARRHQGRDAGPDPAEARKLLETIDTGTLAGLRDRALFSVMLYSFARVSAVLGMRRQDYFQQGSRGWLRLHEKGGKRHDVPAHHRAAEALDEYLDACGLEAAGEALFQSVDRAGERLTGRALSRRVVLAMIKRRASAAGLPPSTLPHVPGDGDHGVSVERGDPRARAADRRARVAKDDEALRPDGGHGDHRRDRTHRDLTGPGERSETAWIGRGRAGLLRRSRGGRRGCHAAPATGRAGSVREAARSDRGGVGFVSEVRRSPTTAASSGGSKGRLTATTSGETVWCPTVQSAPPVALRALLAGPARGRLVTGEPL